MDDQLKLRNYESLATIGSWVTFPYIWGGLFILLYGLYSINFFGDTVVSYVVVGLLCLFFVLPLVPALLVRWMVKPIFLNLLMREIVTAKAGGIGLLGFFLSYAAILFFLGRNLEIAGWFFLAAPVVGILLTTIVTLFERLSGPRVSSRGIPQKADIHIERPDRKSLPPPTRPGLPAPRTSQTPTRSPTSRPSAPSRRSTPPKRPSPPKRSASSGRRPSPPRRR